MGIERQMFPAWERGAPWKYDPYYYFHNESIDTIVEELFFFRGPVFSFLLTTVQLIAMQKKKNKKKYAKLDLKKVSHNSTAVNNVSVWYGRLIW